MYHNWVNNKEELNLEKRFEFYEDVYYDVLDMMK